MQKRIIAYDLQNINENQKVAGKQNAIVKNDITIIDIIYTASNISGPVIPFLSYTAQYL
ncbi:hypothetical prophage protein [Bartonella henselae str. Houston-1]|uniref:Hypothetical prophage protein n=1 Tax=Bartonella henselae (strain ATCC 49882 / DSM 28221 / CCUG 30454 / Houston 1) TaxID=283166 RepID=A0A0H3M4T7_BARHE|nr:hypothetical prophage protein [Bartonella henselae str. Houston-1]